MGFDKLMAPLAGKPVLTRSIEAFCLCDGITKVIVVTDVVRFDAALAGLLNPRSIEIVRVDGGTERHDSVAAGLAAVDASSTTIAVHDGARPLITPASISTCITAAAEFGAATCARRITETMKRSDDNNFVAEPVCRDNLWAMETPQIFSAELIRSAYDHVVANNELVTDEVSALSLIGVKTKLVAHGGQNPKITYPEDIALAESLLK